MKNKDSIEKFLFEYLLDLDELFVKEADILNYLSPYMVAEHLKEKDIVDILEDLCTNEIISSAIAQSDTDLTVPAYMLTERSIKYAEEKKYLNLYEMFNKMRKNNSELNQLIENTDNEIKNINDKINKLVDNNEFNKNKKLLKDIIDNSNKIDNKFKEVEELKSKTVELLGVFVCIFTIVSNNIGYISLVSKEDILLNKISIILTINGTLITALIFILLGIKSIIFNEKIETVNIALIILPIVMIITGVIIR